MYEEEDLVCEEGNPSNPDYDDEVFDYDSVNAYDDEPLKKKNNVDKLLDEQFDNPEGVSVGVDVKFDSVTGRRLRGSRAAGLNKRILSDDSLDEILLEDSD